MEILSDTGYLPLTILVVDLYIVDRFRVKTLTTSQEVHLIAAMLQNDAHKGVCEPRKWLRVQGVRYDLQT